jgi:hypothetical protein
MAHLGGRDVALFDPVVFVDPTRHPMPLPVRMVLRPIRVSEFLRMRIA